MQHSIERDIAIQQPTPDTSVTQTSGENQETPNTSDILNRDARELLHVENNIHTLFKENRKANDQLAEISKPVIDILTAQGVDSRRVTTEMIIQLAEGTTVQYTDADGLLFTITPVRVDGAITYSVTQTADADLELPRYY